MLMDGFSSIQICLDPSDLVKGVFRISEQRFLRGVCEFQSLIWFADENSTAIKSPPDLVASEMRKPSFFKLGSLNPRRERNVRPQWAAG